MLRLFPFFLCLSACTALAPAGVMQLSRVDPLSADPADFEVALHIPDGLQVTDATLTMSAMRASTNDVAGTSVELTQTGRAEGTLEAPAPDATQSLAYFRIATADHVDLRATQARIAAWEDADAEDTRGSLSVSMTACLDGAGPSEDARGSVFVKVAPDSRFFPILRDAKITALLDTIAPDAQCDI